MLWTTSNWRWVEIVRVAYMLGLIDSIGLGSEGETLIRKRLDELDNEGVVTKLGERGDRSPYRFDFTAIPPHDPQPLEMPFAEARRN